MPTDEITIEDLVNWYCEHYNIELWKDIPGYEGLYQVSNTGKVKSLERKVKKWDGERTIPETILKPDSNHGYERVNLRKNNVYKHYLVHRLVAQAFVPNPHNYPQVNHIDEVKTSNNAANLEWCDQEYNVNWGTCLNRRAVTQGKIVQQFTFDGVLVAEYWSAQEAARQTGYSQGDISNCCRGIYKYAYNYVWKYKKGEAV